MFGIQPGRGTNRNEALHKYLNAHMKSARYGVEMAYMLLTTFFYNHNEKICAQREKRQSKLVAELRSWLEQKPSTNEKFGLICTCSDMSEGESTQHVANRMDPLYFDRNSYSDFAARFTASTIPPQLFQGDSQVHHTGNELEEQDLDDITMKDVIDILLRAIGWYAVHNTMSKYTSTAAIQCTFVQANFGYYLASLSTSEHSECDEHSKRLNNVLKSWNFVRVEVPGDGNCLFTSVAITVISLCQQYQSPLAAILHNLGIDPCHDSVSMIAKALRREMSGLEIIHMNILGFFHTRRLKNKANNFLPVVNFLGNLEI